MARFSLLQPDVARTWKNAVATNANYSHKANRKCLQPSVHEIRVVRVAQFITPSFPCSYYHDIMLSS